MCVYVCVCSERIKKEQRFTLGAGILGILYFVFYFLVLLEWEKNMYHFKNQKQAIFIKNVIAAITKENLKSVHSLYYLIYKLHKCVYKNSQCSSIEHAQAPFFVCVTVISWPDSTGCLALQYSAKGFCYKEMTRGGVVASVLGLSGCEILGKLPSFWISVFSFVKVIFALLLNRIVRIKWDDVFENIF